MSRIVPRDWLEWAWAVCIALNVGVGVGAVTVGEWWRAVDAVTIGILFALLVRFRRLAKYWEAETAVQQDQYITGTLPVSRPYKWGLPNWGDSFSGAARAWGWFTPLWRIRKRGGAWCVYRRPSGRAYTTEDGYLLVARYPTFTAALRHTERNRQ